MNTMPATSDQTAFETVITPDKSHRDGRFRLLWRYRDLTMLLVKRNCVATYLQSILGPFWLVLNALLTSVVFSLVFGRFIGISSDGSPHMLFYLAGNTIWSLFSKCVMQNADTFVKNRNIYSKVYFPRFTMVMATSLTNVVTFFIQFGVLLCFFLYYLFTGAVAGFTWMWLVIPALMLQSMLLGTAVGMLIASVAVKYRDFLYMVNFAIQLWMYATPIVYPLSKATGKLRLLMLANPMTPIVQNFRYAVYGMGEFLGGAWLVSIGITLLIFWLALRAFERREKDMIDVL